MTALHLTAAAASTMILTVLIAVSVAGIIVNRGAILRALKGE